MAKTLIDTVTKRKRIPVEPKEDKLYPKQKIVSAKNTKPPGPPKAPTMEQVQDVEWMNWVEYAQSRIRYLENKLALQADEIEAHKGSIDRLKKRILQG